MNHASHTWQADKYSQNSQYQYQTFMKLIKNNPFIGNESVLDIGCGDGKISAELADLVSEGDVVAIDNSSTMLQFAQQNHQRKNLTFKYCDAENLTSLNKCFDVIVSSFCLHWVEHKQKAFNEIAACLKSGGKFMMVVSCRNQVMANVRDEMIKSIVWKDYFYDFMDTTLHIEDADYDQYATMAGLTIDKYDTEAVRVDFPSSESLEDFFSNLTPHLGRLPDERLKKKFMEEAVKKYLTCVPVEKDGACHMMSTCIYLVGKK